MRNSIPRRRSLLFPKACPCAADRLRARCSYLPVCGRLILRGHTYRVPSSYAPTCEVRGLTVVTMRWPKPARTFVVQTSIGLSYSVHTSMALGFRPPHSNMPNYRERHSTNHSCRVPLLGKHS